MGAQASFLSKAGGDQDAAIQAFMAAGQKNPVGVYRDYQNALQSGNTALAQELLQKGIGQSMKGKVHGVVKTIGKGLSALAPLAALAIPGVGPLATAGIAAAGSAGGRALQGKSFSLGDTLLKGASAYGADKVLGAAKGAQAVAGGGGGGGAAAPASGGFFNTIGGYAKDALGKLGGGNPLLGGATLALGIKGEVEAGQQRKAIENAANYRNQLLSRGLGQAEDAYAARAPMREGGMAAVSKFLANPRGLFQTPGEGAASAGAPAPARPSAMQLLGNLQAKRPMSR